MTDTPLFPSGASAHVKTEQREGEEEEGERMEGREEGEAEPVVTAETEGPTSSQAAPVEEEE